MTTMRVVGECFFWYRLTRVFRDKFHRAVKRLCVCVCVHFPLLSLCFQQLTWVEMPRSEWVIKWVNSFWTAYCGPFTTMKLFNNYTHNTEPFYGSVEFVRDNPGEPVPEETFTHSHSSWSSIIPICFLHLLRSMASSVFNSRALQSFSTISLQVFFGLPLGLVPPLQVVKRKCKTNDVEKPRNFILQEWSSCELGRHIVL